MKLVKPASITITATLIDADCLRACISSRFDPGASPVNSFPALIIETVSEYALMTTSLGVNDNHYH
ncbi:hypothetical protein AL013_00225 [Mariprofundus ferrooxydans]|jgi:hypothetical protein|uniref:Uncharacterized protein n=1 Tax=Mariprofundus ferrooxydans PV-1 TaxID=314345 RepID=Q0EZ47_9PROT|nr:hypothetical protein SPV1_07776 [Mariprofundus ferrooxydans PV-1]KON48814.1 hypothetical protein AL013_00225 [Mariprofundus ferrooxydans]